MPPRAGKAADVSQKLNVRGGEQLEQLFDGPRGMADGPDRLQIEHNYIVLKPGATIIPAPNSLNAGDADHAPFLRAALRLLRFLLSVCRCRRPPEHSVHLQRRSEPANDRLLSAIMAVGADAEH